MSTTSPDGVNSVPAEGKGAGHAGIVHAIHLGSHALSQPWRLLRPSLSTPPGRRGASDPTWLASAVWHKLLTRAVAVVHAQAAVGVLHKAAAAVGLLDDALLPGGLERPLQAGGADLSGGQRLRLAVARAMLTDRIVLADEPTAKLDWHTAALVRRVLVGMAASRLVVVATHDRQLTAAADQVIDLSGQQSIEVAA